MNEQMKGWLSIMMPPKVETFSHGRALPDSLAAPPPAQAKQNWYLNLILSLALGLTLVAAVALLALVTDSMRLQRSMYIIIGLLSFWVILLFLSHKGRAKEASILLTAGLAMNAFMVSFFSGGVQQVSYASYTIAILTGGLLLGRKTIPWLVVIGILEGLSLVLLETYRVIEPLKLVGPVIAWAVFSLGFIWVAFILSLALKSNEDTLSRLRLELFERERMQKEMQQLMADQLRLHEESRQCRGELSWLYETAVTLNRFVDTTALLNGLYVQIDKMFAPGAFLVVMLQTFDALPALRVVYAVEEGKRLNDWKGLIMPLEDSGLTGWVVRNQKPLLIRDMTSETLPVEPKHCLRPARSWMGVPLASRSRTLGAISVQSYQPNAFEDHHCRFLELVSAQVAVSIENSNLFEDLQTSKQQLDETRNLTLEGWARALQLRDRATEEHSERVVSLTLKLASEMGITSEEELERMRWGALLHDIGKMGIPDSILQKPDRLTPEEWKVMVQHPEYAYYLLSPIPFLQSALTIPLYHHEWWNGSGYPRGLKGEEIPLAARIFAIVDVWDALRSGRSYRSAWKDEEVLPYIESQSGRQFDPRVVDAFMKVIKS